MQASGTRAGQAPARQGGMNGWMVAGLVAVGAGAWAWYMFGPDLRRYLRIREM
jgi:hypothetical protein